MTTATEERMSYNSDFADEWSILGAPPHGDCHRILWLHWTPSPAARGLTWLAWRLASARYRNTDRVENEEVEHIGLSLVVCLNVHLIGST